MTHTITRPFPFLLFLAVTVLIGLTLGPVPGLAPGWAHAQMARGSEKAGETKAASALGLPLPRFVSLRSNEVNLRTGPGVQYPVDWIYRKKGLPLQVIAEYQSWRKVRDWEGAVGWVHQSMLMGGRALIVTGKTSPLRAKATGDAIVIARAEVGVVGRLLECPDGMAWCRAGVGDFEGWMEREAFWGVLAGEAIK